MAFRRSHLALVSIAFAAPVAPLAACSSSDADPPATSAGTGNVGNTNPGGGFNPGGGNNPGGGTNPGAGTNPGGGTNPGAGTGGTSAGTGGDMTSGTGGATAGTRSTSRGRFRQPGRSPPRPPGTGLWSGSGNR